MCEILKNFRIIISIVFLAGGSLLFYSCGSTNISMPISCICSSWQFNSAISDTLQALNYLIDSTGYNFVSAYRWINDGTSVRKVMVSLQYDSVGHHVNMTVLTTIQFRGTETTVNFTETKGFPGGFRTDFYPLLASLRSYCNSTLPPRKKQKAKAR